MTSRLARGAIEAAVTEVALPWPVFDLSDYNSLEEILPSISAESVLLQYIVSDDLMQTIGGEFNQGWEESGTVAIHLIVPTGFDSSSVVDKGDEIRIGLRGRRLADGVVIESCTPFTDFGGGGFGVNGSVHGWAANLYYTRHMCG
jgi:hypothetical protein